LFKLAGGSVLPPKNPKIDCLIPLEALGV